MSLNFNIYDNAENLIGNVTKKFVSVSDKYEISINDESKLLIILAIVVAIANDINRVESNSVSSAGTN